MLYRVLLGLLVLIVYGSDVASVAAVTQPNAAAARAAAVQVEAANDETESPPLLINGVASDVSVEAGTMVVAETFEGAEINIFEDAHCSGNPVGHWREESYPILYNAALTIFFQARWIQEPTVHSACLQLEWRNDPPTLTLNGASQNVTVPVGTIITLSHSDNAELGQFSTEGCTGNPDWNEWSTNRNGVEARSDTPETRYWMARRLDKPELTSPCLAMTWFREDSGPPVLTLNGGTDPVSVPAGTAVSFNFPAGSTMWEFETATCTGNEYRIFQAIQHRTFDEPGTRSYFAAWNEDSSARSACIEATWLDRVGLNQPAPVDRDPGMPDDRDSDATDTGLPGPVSMNHVTALPASGAGVGATPWPTWAGTGLLVYLAAGLFSQLRRINQP